MAVRTTAPVGAPVWIDLGTSDLDKAQQFYGAIFGWTFESAGPEYGGYVNAFRDGRPVAGLMANDPQWNAPDGWTTYLHTTDIAATVDKATAAGGTNCMAPMEVPGQGWMAIVTDPTDAVFGLWQPTGHRGYELVNEHGAPTYFQLTNRTYTDALDFYRTVFDWKTEVESDTDEFRYSTASFDGEALLGVMDGSVLGEQTSSTWTIFFAADDVDKTVQLVIGNGGSVVRAAEDTPYGRLAALADPTGAQFNLSSIQA